MYRVIVHLLDGTAIESIQTDGQGNMLVHITPSGVLVYQTTAGLVDHASYEFLPWSQVERVTSRKITQVG